MDVDECVVLAIAIAVLGGLVWVVAWGINQSDTYEAQFKARCDKVHGSVMWGRDTDFCLNGNTILFMNS